MIIYERFDVLTALYPFVDIPQRKPRPALVLSSGHFNAAHGHFVGAMITTAADSHWPSDYVIRDLAAAGLRHRSVVRFKVFTVPFAVIGRRIGVLAAPGRAAVSVVLGPILCGAGP